MYENENKNMNGLGNENMEHRDVPETAVNWTIPGDGRSRQRQNTQSQNTEGQYSQGQGSQGPANSMPRDQTPDSAHMAAGPTARTAMAGIPIRDTRAAAISTGIIPTKNALQKGWRESRQQRSYSEPYQAES